MEVELAADLGGAAVAPVTARALYVVHFAATPDG